MWPVKLISTNTVTKTQVVGASPNGEVFMRDGTLPKDTFALHLMTQVDRLRAKGITGKGVKIAVIDSGIDFTHPALGNGCFGKGCLVSFAAQPNPLGFTGEATGITLGAYRVMGCEGESANDVLVAAFNKAFEDGANIITASIGGAEGFSDSPWAVTASRIVQAGVPVTISAGNDGHSGLFYFGDGASGKGVTAVASYDNIDSPVVSYHSTYNINNGDKIDFIYTPGALAE
ncbi:probable subtilisin-like serine protease [Claviceps purpurea 20.1]|uniref:Probable subtilisin-like serine protease n=1 Tax=Claviceps purpurea (strain 20.1) TaxID=1111077 RepID=M1W9Q8_CLAP2|nr:probable subtilisin-like serine protease [Claviceps purpurea 20.1]